MLLDLTFDRNIAAMPSKKKRAKDTPEKQHARFVEAAKASEADEAPDAMDKAFKALTIARASIHKQRNTKTK